MRGTPFADDVFLFVLGHALAQELHTAHGLSLWSGEAMQSLRNSCSTANDRALHAMERLSTDWHARHLGKQDQTYDGTDAAP